MPLSPAVTGESTKRSEAGEDFAPLGPEACIRAAVEVGQGGIMFIPSRRILPSSLLPVCSLTGKDCQLNTLPRAPRSRGWGPPIESSRGSRNEWSLEKFEDCRGASCSVTKEIAQFRSGRTRERMEMTANPLHLTPHTAKDNRTVGSPVCRLDWLTPTATHAACPP